MIMLSILATIVNILSSWTYNLVIKLKSQIDYEILFNNDIWLKIVKIK